MANEFNQTIPLEVQQRIQAHLDGIKQELASYLILLTPKERKNRLKMADKRVAFVQKVTAYATGTPTLVPAFVESSGTTQKIPVHTAHRGFFCLAGVLLEVPKVQRGVAQAQLEAGELQRDVANGLLEVWSL